MRFILLIGLFIPIISFSQGDTLTQLPDHTWTNNVTRYHPIPKFDTMFYPNKKIKTIGQFSNQPWLSGNPTGYWKEFYENGQLKSFGEYQAEFFENIWNLASSKSISYKIGYWVYYYADGRLKALGEYKLEKKGYLIKSLITEKWIIYDSSGEKSNNKEPFISELEDVKTAM